MEKFSRPAIDHLKEIAWSIFMIDLVLVLLAALFWRHFGTTYTFSIFGGLAAMVTGFIGGLALLNVGFVWAHERWKHRTGSRS